MIDILWPEITIAEKGLPDGMTFEEGAAFGLVYQTSWCALTHRTRVRRGETLLVHGAAGDVGLSAVQIGKGAGGARARHRWQHRKARGGARGGRRRADQLSNRGLGRDGRGADVIYDPVGGDVFDGSTRCIA